MVQARYDEGTLRDITSGLLLFEILLRAFL